MITPPEDESHAKAARKILSTPDALLVLAIGGDHLQDGIDAIQSCLDNKVLRPHFAFVEAKRVGTRFGKRQADLKKALGYLDKSTIMSPAEVKRTAEVIGAGKKDLPTNRVKEVSKLLKEKLGGSKSDHEIAKIVDSM